RSSRQSLQVFSGRLDLSLMRPLRGVREVLLDGVDHQPTEPMWLDRVEFDRPMMFKGGGACVGQLVRPGGQLPVPNLLRRHAQNLKVWQPAGEEAGHHVVIWKYIWVHAMHDLSGHVPHRRLGGPSRVGATRI